MKILILWGTKIIEVHRKAKKRRKTRSENANVVAQDQTGEFSTKREYTNTKTYFEIVFLTETLL
jgi:hypothetical protein